MLNWLYNWVIKIFGNNDSLADNMMMAVQNENNFKNMNLDELELNQKYDRNTIELKEFDIDPNKITLLIIDDYIGIMRTPEMLINLADDLHLKDFNIIKFWGIQAGKELLYWLDENPNIRIDIGIIDVLINGIDGVDIVHKIKEHNPDIRFKFYTGIDMESNEYKANKARAKFLKFLPDEVFEDKVILKSQSFKDVIAPSMYKLIRG